MRVLYLAQRVPYPPHRGDKIITYHQVLHLAQRHEVIVVCLAQDAEELAHAEALRGIAAEVHAVPLSPVRARLRALRSLLSGQPFTLGYFDEPRLRQCVDTILAERRIDAAIVFCSGMAQFVEPVRQLPRIVHFADLDSLKWKQYATAARMPIRWIYGLESQRLLEYERRLARTCDQSIVCTPQELKDFQRLVAEERVTCMPNGVDTEYFQPAGTPRAEDSLIFTGVMDYLPNIDAARWFCQEILPRVRQHRPRTTFTICGARPVAAVRALAAAGGITVTGSVPDVRPYLASASVAVVPVRIARGIQNKVLEAMAMGLPVVTTSKAFTGIEATPGTELLVADQPQAFAESVVGLLEDRRRREQLGHAARARIEEHYSWEVPLAQLDALLQTVVQGKRTPHCCSTV